ncbi:DNA polymerase III subunit delta [Rubrobacter xylanophilus]|uniref:DNA-directed DNA polymerase n=1 Tax=Rubrobacter xylanophilus TaxID=49319 RepID=A0A510HG98_9ACTN|nr:DNA polymerase III subunit delta [Rubrobacter xylanophilus]BBL78976.1 DNA polymerase III subunit delta [Rubrobacter xylanophilus]
MTVYLLLGDDEERKLRGLERLRRGRQPQTFDAAEDGPEAVVSACGSYSLFGGGAFVVVRNLDAWNAAQKSVITSYLENPSPETDLVLLGGRLGARERLLAAAKRVGEVHVFERPTGKALVRWVTDRARKMGLELPEEVARELALRCSEDKLRLLGELEKLALYVPEGKVATRKDVEALCPPDVEANIFSFVDALSSGNSRRALPPLEHLLAAGEPPQRIAYMARRQFRLVSRTRALLARGVSRPELARELGVPPFVARKLEEQARVLEERNLERALALMLHLESGLKGRSSLPEGLQVELAVLGLL